MSRELDESAPKRNATLPLQLAKWVPENDHVTGMRVNRWTRYGKDRLYVMDDERRLGWYDLVDDELHVHDDQRASEIRAALAGHPAMADRLATSRFDSLAGSEPAFPPAQEVKSVTSRMPANGPGEVAGVHHPEVQAAEIPVRFADSMHDLAANRPGQAVRARAVEEREAQLAAHPIRSRLARLFDAKTDERAWRVGAEGEESVGRRLDKLVSRGWRVLHSIPVGERGSDIDHLLIGPGGVWTVNTKRHLGARVWLAPHQIRINGHVQPYLRNSRFEAKRTADLLAGALGWTPPVRPALVLQLGMLADPITVKQAPDDVDVLDARSVPRWFAKQRSALTGEQVEAVLAVARVPATWRCS